MRAWAVLASPTARWRASRGSAAPWSPCPYGPPQAPVPSHERGFEMQGTRAQRRTVISAGGRADMSVHQRDRKSTRLNSSHGYISYAVFCLKKKKKNRKVLLAPTPHLQHAVT